MRVAGDTIIILLELNCTWNIEIILCAQAIGSNAMAKQALYIDKNNIYGGSPLALDTSGVQRKNKESENDNESLRTIFSNPSTITIAPYMVDDIKCLILENS